MAGKLSFSIAINLLTENFKKGTNTVKNGFRSMQAQILTFAAALGLAGVSLSNLISDIIRVARETSKANTALKNVSGSTAQYASNLRFASSLSKKYGVYVNDITSSFAKFTAAANISGMAMEDQRKLFESLSRAATGFGLSSDETRGMFLAVTQMMGKGKIQAEELRGQLGERLPIAMQAMAKAAGTTVAGLDDIMKKGQLLSSEVLPKFADALNEMLPSVNTDNIETSLNRLRNAFQEIVDSSGVQGAYKGLIDGLTNFVNTAKDKISMLVTFIIALVSGKLLVNILKFFNEQFQVLNRAVKKHEVAETQKQLATQKRIEAEKLYEAVKTDYEKVENGKRLASKAQLTKAKRILDAAELAQKKAFLAEQTAAENAAAIKSMGFWKKTGSVIIATGERISMALKSVWSTVWPMALVTAIAGIIAGLRQMYTEAKRIKNILPETRKLIERSNQTSISTETIKIQQLKNVIDDIAASTKDRKNALSQLNSILGTNYSWDEKTLSVQGDINNAIRERIRLLGAEARVSALGQEKQKLVDRQTELQNSPVNSLFYQQGFVNYLKGSKVGQFFGFKTDKQLNKEELENTQKAIVLLNSQMEGAIKETLTSNTGTGIPTPPDPDKKEKSPLEKEEEKYAQAVQELTNKLNNRAISEEEYKKKLNDLNKATYDTLSGMLTPEEAAKSKTYQTVKNFSVSSEFREAEANYKAEIGKYSNLLKNGAISEEEYQKARLDLLQSTIKAIASLDSLSEAEKEQLNAMLNESQQLQSSLVKRPELEAYDTTFDYKKSETEILEGQLSVAEANLEKIKAAYNEGAKELISELNEAIGEVDTLGDALKIAEVKKDVKDLTRQLNEGVYSGVKEIASGSGRLVSAFSELRDVFRDEDASAWERIMAVWNTMINTVDAFMSIIKTIESLTEITQKLAKAKEAEAATDTKTTATKVTNATTEATAEITSAGTAIVADETAAAVKKQTAIQNVSASTAEGAADAGKSAAKLPFPLNIVAIGGAIAAALAAFAAIPKFAGGGIVQGSSTGDRNLARVNGGEMILNGRQQATLFQLANGKGIKTNGTVVSGELRAQGTELIAVIKNTERKTGRGR